MILEHSTRFAGLKKELEAGDKKAVESGGSGSSLELVMVTCSAPTGDYHFFPNIFPKSLDSFQKFGKVWKSWKKVWKNFSKLYWL
jgi:hypothetical protein